MIKARFIGLKSEIDTFLLKIEELFECEQVGSIHEDGQQNQTCHIYYEISEKRNDNK